MVETGLGLSKKEMDYLNEAVTDGSGMWTPSATAEKNKRIETEKKIELSRSKHPKCWHSCHIPNWNNVSYSIADKHFKEIIKSILIQDIICL